MSQDPRYPYVDSDPTAVRVLRAVQANYAAEIQDRIDRRIGARRRLAMTPLDNPPHQLRERRHHAGIRQCDVVQALDFLGICVGATEYIDYELGRENVPSEVRRALAALYSTTPKELMTPGFMTLAIPADWTD